MKKTSMDIKRCIKKYSTTYQNVSHFI